MGMLALGLAAPGGGVQPGEVQIHWGKWEPPPAARIAVQTNLVEIGVVVRDRQGAAAGGFRAGDFEVLDNGKPQMISVFSEQKPAESRATGAATLPGEAHGTAAAPERAPEPRSIVLWVDDVYATPFSIQKARLAARQIIESLADGEQVGIYTSSATVTVDLTRDTEALLAAVARLKADALPGPHELGACPLFDPYRSFAISHHVDEEVRQRAILQAIACRCPGGGASPDERTKDPCVLMMPGVVDSDAADVWTQFRGRAAAAVENLIVPIRRLAQAPGGRVLLMLSPGFVTGDMDPQLSRLMDTAVRAHIVVNALNPEGLSTLNEQRRQQLITSGLMADVSTATGGRFVQNNNDITGVARELLAQPEVSYVLGFGAAGEPDGKTHALKVALTRGGSYHIDARKAYFSAPPEPAPETPQVRIDRAAMSNAPLAQFPATTRVSARDPRGGRYTLHIDTQVGVHALKFAGDDARHLQQLTFVTVLENAGGEYISGKMAVMDLQLTTATWSEFQAKGIKTGTTFSVAPGSYRVRQVIREAVQDQMAASYTPIEVK